MVLLTSRCHACATPISLDVSDAVGDSASTCDVTERRSWCAVFAGMVLPVLSSWHCAVPVSLLVGVVRCDVVCVDLRGGVLFLVVPVFCSRGLRCSVCDYVASFGDGDGFEDVVGNSCVVEEWVTWWYLLTGSWTVPVTTKLSCFHVSNGLVGVGWFGWSPDRSPWLCDV